MQVLKVVLGSVVGQMPGVFDEPQDTLSPAVSSEVFIQTNAFLSFPMLSPLYSTAICTGFFLFLLLALVHTLVILMYS